MTLSFFITVIPDHDKPQPPGCLLDRVVKKAIVDKPLDLFHDSYYFYMKTGSERALTYRKIPTSLVVAEEDLPF
ncbi:hypothetical protein C6X66_20090 [Escherichia coli]|nr:hypothetical protein C6X66_20090 [Escherichia coli]PTO19325.1 hypothetical protein DAT31_00060 [Escherichia coli]